MARLRRFAVLMIVAIRPAVATTPHSVSDAVAAAIGMMGSVFGIPRM